ncbi:MAG: polymer-forming cytoskeletal protein [Candidatus Margulisbacteria bacterium]|nr:polymer-forming cytoskeletal protein [Candidatus Margulisiibacteriota bacterium]
MGIFNNLGGKRLAGMLEGVVGSVVGENARFKGEFTANGSININGEFDGKIKVDGEVIVSPGGRVMGEVEGGSVIISGRVDGNIKARETLEITKTGRVNGDLTGGRIIIEEGSFYHGRVSVSNPQEVALPQEPQNF